MKPVLLILAALLFFQNAEAQSALADPSKWSFKVSPGDVATTHERKSFKLEFLVALKPGWHIYALDPGGDGSLIPPTFRFKDSARLKMEEVVEGERPQEMTVDGIDGKVRYFEGRASFFTTVAAKKGQQIRGTYTYQLCNDKMCLPPKTAPFVFKIP